MDPDIQLWRDAKRIFDRLAHLPTERWRARLDGMSLDREVLKRVMGLFAAHAQAEGLLERPLLISAEVGGLVGRQLGPWVLEAELGRGGSAVVYRARAHQDGTERLAALKLVTVGSLARTGLERFDQEQRILARLNHPHIAQLFDVGRAEDGTPWLAMALVEGVPIDTWCQTRGLLPRAIVPLFLDVCDAVAYAHRNLVIHRDIKPSNVLVDEHGHVRLLDFGIARLLDDDSVATATQWRALTPQYAAPEQFTGALPSTAMDVFGLGALLYRLLSGRAPRSVTASADETPIAPSRTAENTGTSSPAARRELRGDLDRVVLKALAVKPEDRYASVPDLAQDLRRWLRGEPVSATEPSLAYRARKFVVRHRLGVGALTAVGLALIIGIITTAWQANRAQQEAARAQAVKRFVTGMLSDASPEAVGGTADIREALARGAVRARSELVATPELEAELLLLIGELQSSFQQFEAARQQFEDALILIERAGALRALRGRALAGLGFLRARETRYDEAISYFDAAIVELTEFDERESLMTAYQARAVTHQLVGRLEAAHADLDLAEAVEVVLEPKDPQRRTKLLGDRSAVLIAGGRYREAYSVLTEILATGSHDRPVDSNLYRMLGEVAESLGHWTEAESAYRRSLEVARKGYPDGSPALAFPYSYLATFLRRIGHLAEAESMARETLRLQQESLPAGSPGLAISTSNLGVVLRDLGRYDEALSYLTQASGMVDASVGRDHPISAWRLGHLALTLAQANRNDTAQQVVGATQARLIAAREAGIELPRAYASVYTLLALAALELGEASQALDFIDAAEHAESPSIPWTDPTRVSRAALRVKALVEAGRGFEATMHARALELRLGRMGATEPFFERAHALAILARAALARGDFYTAATLAPAALHRSENVKYPGFVEAELSVLGAAFRAPLMD